MNYLAVKTTFELFFSKVGRQVGAQVCFIFDEGYRKKCVKVTIYFRLFCKFGKDSSDDSLTFYLGPFALQADTFPV